MVHRPTSIGAFKFAVLASLRAAQLCCGCLPRVEGDHCNAVTAQLEVADGAVKAAVEAEGDAPQGSGTDAPALEPVLTGGAR